MEEMKYGFKTTVELLYEETLDRVKVEMQRQGFEILTERDSLEKKGEKLLRRHLILGSANPGAAYQAMIQEKEIGAIIPCNFIVYEEEGMTVVAALNPIQALQETGKPQLEGLVSEISERLKRVISNLR